MTPLEAIGIVATAVLILISIVAYYWLIVAFTLPVPA